MRARPFLMYSSDGLIRQHSSRIFFPPSNVNPLNSSRPSYINNNLVEFQVARQFADNSQEPAIIAFLPGRYVRCKPFHMGGRFCPANGLVDRQGSVSAIHFNGLPEDVTNLLQLVGSFYYVVDFRPGRWNVAKLLRCFDHLLEREVVRILVGKLLFFFLRAFSFCILCCGHFFSP